MLYNLFPETNEKLHILSELCQSVRSVTVFSASQKNNMKQLSSYKHFHLCHWWKWITTFWKYNLQIWSAASIIKWHIFPHKYV